MSIAMKEYRLPGPLVAFLKTCRLHGVPEVTTGLQHQRVTVSRAWDLRTPAPTRSKKTVQTPSARQQQEQPIRQATPPQPTTINVQTATIVFSRQEKTATPAPAPTVTMTRPAPKPALAPSPDLANDVRPMQQQRRASPTVTTINDQPLKTTTDVTNDDTCAPPAYDDFDTRPREVGKTFPRLRQDLLDRETRRRGTDSHRPSPPMIAPTRDSQRRSTSILPTSYDLRMDTLQGVGPSIITRPGGTTSTATPAHQQGHCRRGRGQTRQGATILQQVERGLKRNHLLATSTATATVMASDDLLKPNWLSGHHVLENIFGLILNSKF